MKSALAAIAFATGLAIVAVDVDARDRFDVGDLRCRDMIELAHDDEDAFATIVIWLDGYLSGITGDTTFDVRFLERFTEQLILRCNDKPRRRVIEVAREVGTR
jgi:acid stress chaperone HdeB